jgi:hypothetical protein
MNFLIYEENFLFFFNSVGHFQILRLKGGYSLLTLPSNTLCWTVMYTEESSSTLAHTQQPFKLLTLVVFLTLHNYPTPSLMNDTEKRT